MLMFVHTEGERSRLARTKGLARSAGVDQLFLPEHLLSGILEVLKHCLIIS